MSVEKKQPAGLKPSVVSQALMRNDSAAQLHEIDAQNGLLNAGGRLFYTCVMCSASICDLPPVLALDGYFKYTKNEYSSETAHCIWKNTSWN